MTHATSLLRPAGPWAVLLFTLPLLVSACAPAPAAQPAERSPKDFAERLEERAALVERIEREVALTRRQTGREELDSEVLEAMRTVPRHEFVPERLEPHAYLNRPLPIGHGQTISQPYIVALMTDLAEVDGDDRVLEVGTGSAYQAAVLAEIVDAVYTLEIVPELAASAEERLERLGYDNVHARHGDGYHGWPEHAPFDAIVVTAAASHVPPPLVEQLRPGGKMVIPVGSPFATQQLMVVEKTEEGKVRNRQVLPVASVPLTRADGGEESPGNGGGGS